MAAIVGEILAQDPLRSPGNLRPFLDIRENPCRTILQSLQNDLKYRLKRFFERALLGIFSRVFALNGDHTHLGTQRQEGHMPGAQIDIDAVTPIVDEGSRLFEVFRIVQIDRGGSHRHQARLATQRDKCLDALDVPV
jgi:hypothetical protein